MTDTGDPCKRPDVHALRDLRFDMSDARAKRLLVECEFVQVGDRRLYYDRNDSRGGEFTCVQFVTAGIGYASVWDDPDVMVSIVFHGHAAFDGVRHLWFTADSDCDSGYVYYPDPRQLGELLIKLDELFPDRS